jgi:hypothetical protein
VQSVNSGVSCVVVCLGGGRDSGQDFLLFSAAGAGAQFLMAKWYVFSVNSDLEAGWNMAFADEAQGGCPGL